MMGLRVLLVIVGLQCAFTLIEAQQKSFLLMPSDFDPPTKLTNLTAQQQHQLLVETLLQKEEPTIMVSFQLELFAKSNGDDFYGFTAEESANAENNAVAKASFECFTQLLHQTDTAKVISSASARGVAYAKKTGSISKGFSHFCSSIDENLKNETCYTVAKENLNKQQMQTSPNKTYHYGIPKSDDEFRKIFAELINDPHMKKQMSLVAYGTFNSYEESVTSKSILELATLPGKLESVQKVYEESIETVASQIKDVSPDQIDLNSPLGDNINKLKPILSETLVSKINENPNLKNDFERIYKRVRHDMQ